MSDPTVKILYSDGELAVAVKPAGIQSQEAHGEESMISLLRDRLGGEFYPVHRLDRETAGVIAYARTQSAAASLSEQFRGDGVTKFYLAVLLGSPEPPSGELNDLLYHDTRRNKSYVVSCMRRGVREASLAYAVAERRGKLTLTAIRLGTGRTHQIRVQFASRGTPVYGDRRYGGKPDRDRWGEEIGSFRGVALYCAAMEMCHPSTGERMSFASRPVGGIWDIFDTEAAVLSFGGLGSPHTHGG